MIALLAASFGLTAPAMGRAEQLPLWELGAGAAALSFPDYRGSDERKQWLLPFPYVIYRGEHLRAEEGRIRGVFFDTDRVELDVSLNGSVPVDSEDNVARRGMPDLDAIAEIGPTLNFLLARSDDRKRRLDLRLPLRAAIATDFSHFRHVGWTFQPNLAVEVRDPLGHAGWKASLLAGPIFGDDRYHRYFYEVDPAFATPARPAYRPGGGYAGAQVLGALSKRYRQFWVGGFVRWDTVAGATFEDSPLVKQKTGLAAGISFAWVFGESKQRVEVNR